jgi:hypothetical protein
LKVTVPFIFVTFVVVVVKVALSAGRNQVKVTRPGEYLTFTIFGLPRAPIPGIVTVAAVTFWELQTTEPLTPFELTGPYPFQPSARAIE